jgi:hypothetical protein
VIATPGEYLPPASWSLAFAHMRRAYRELVDGWLYWSVLTLARRRTDDVVLQVRTAQKACVRLWAD